MNEKRAKQAKAYVKEVLRSLDLAKLDNELLVNISQAILHAYFKGQEDLQNELLGNPN